MFIDRWEKARLKDQVATLEIQVENLMQRILQLERWIQYETSTPKNRGRPVGSKNKEKV